MRGMNLYNPDFNAPEKPHLFLEFHGSQTSIEEQIDMFRIISAEHGGAYDLMQQIKSTIDPLNIMNPGKIFMEAE